VVADDQEVVIGPRAELKAAAVLGDDPRQALGVVGLLALCPLQARQRTTTAASLTDIFADKGQHTLITDASVARNVGGFFRRWA
jgi:hypothetical protein